MQTRTHIGTFCTQYVHAEHTSQPYLCHTLAFECISCFLPAGGALPLLIWPIAPPGGYKL